MSATLEIDQTITEQILTPYCFNYSTTGNKQTEAGHLGDEARGSLLPSMKGRRQALFGWRILGSVARNLRRDTRTSRQANPVTDRTSDIAY